VSTGIHAIVQQNRSLWLGLHVAAFLSGFLTMALEMLIGRTFIPYFGGTIYTWGALISIFLSGMTAGYVLGGKAADRSPAPSAIAVLFIASAALVMAVPLFGEAIINGVLDRIEDVRYAALAASLALACLPAATLAAVCPYCVRLLLERNDNSGTVSGRLSGLATAGSILGTLGTSFFFIPLMGVSNIYNIVASAGVAMAVYFFAVEYRRQRRTRVGHSAALLCLAASVLLAALASTPGYAQPSPIMMRKDGLLERVDSEYNTIFIEKHGSLVSMNFGYRANRYTESIIDVANPADLVVVYTRYMSTALAYVQHDVKKVALIGLGGGRTISYFAASLPQATAEVAELDPSVIEMAQKYFGVANNNRLRIVNKDGRVFLNQTKDKFDVILVDAYRGPFVPFHLTTQEFYRLVKSRLTEGGVVAQNVEPSTMFFDSAYATMKSVFAHVDAFEASGNIVLIGYDEARPSDAELARRAAAVQAKLNLKYDLRELVKARKEVTVDAGAKVLTDDFAPVEMLKTIKRHNEKKAP
jgi:spermidine synthase